MSASNKIVIAFDAYGTLLSTESIAKQLATHVGKEKADYLAAQWRLYQLEFTWRLNSMNQYEDFSKVTLRALQRTLKENDVELEEGDVESLMKAYDSLSTFPDVGPALTALAKEKESITAVVFSNGTTKMVSTSVHESPDLSPHADVFADIVVVEEVQKFKPHPDVYYHLAGKVGKTREQMGEMWLITGNPFDVVGARAVGMKAAWVDRQGKGWMDTLVEGKVGRPTVIVKSLEEVVEVVKKSK